jgi:hypothetical protein
MMATTESCPSGHNDDDADENLSPAPSGEASAPLVQKRLEGFFEEEDDLVSLS